MKILTQDKECLINMELLEKIYVSENHGDGEQINVIKSVSLRGSFTNYGINLGTYETKERAMEILNDIQNTIALKYMSDLNFSAVFGCINDKKIRTRNINENGNI
ncbi:MAG: hypothetical protein IKG42_04805 [Clostridia bacterium]|nr:hypothetical protein [Clostridia bacterium]